LRRTIIGLLDISRMEAGAFDYEMEHHDIRSVVQNALKEYEVQFAEKRRSLDLRLPIDPLWVDCDSDRLGQIVSNLIDNAFKFSPERAPIEVTVQALSQAPATAPRLLASGESNAAKGYALIRVADRGAGVPDNHKQLIFEKYHQVKSGKKLAGQGVGLGLVICRNIALAHGGAIWVEDNPAGGSVFCLLIPLSASDASQPAAPLGRAATAGRIPGA
jgi:signal transduction histidine kinase